MLTYIFFCISRYTRQKDLKLCKRTKKEIYIKLKLGNCKNHETNISKDYWEIILLTKKLMICSKSINRYQ